MRIVIKLGTSTLAHKTGRVNIRRIEKLCKVVSDLKNAGNEIIMVSSGAIGMGVGKLNLNGRPEDMPSKQAAASVGQCELMYTYDKLFSEYNYTVAQILLVGADIQNENRRINFQNTLYRLLELGTIPVINENDTVSTAEIGIGENDTLAATVAVTINADLLIILSDIDGLYDSDPRKNKNAKLVTTVKEITDDIIAMTGDSVSALGTGGMITKLRAAKLTTENGTDMIIANGKDPDILYDILEGKAVGTRFLH